jgi:hypothetical protein
MQDTNETYFECKNCKKKYRSRTGLRNHAHTCKEPPSGDLNLANNLMSSIQALHEKIERLEQPHITNHNNNHQIHVYLNTHCKNAMNMDQFIENMTLRPDDFEVFFKKQFYEGAFKILQKQLTDLAVAERPLHCVNPTLNKPKTFFIKNEDEWKEETQGDFVYQMKCIDEWQNEEEKMLLTQFFQKFNDKMWDGWKELCAKDERYQRLSDRMRRVTNSDDKMSVLEDLAKVVEWKDLS